MRPITAGMAGAARGGPPVWLLGLALLSGCGGEKAESPPQQIEDVAPPTAEVVEPAPEATPLPSDLAPFLQPWTGDLDGMIKRRMVRILTVRNPVLYYVDKGREVGITYEVARDFEAQVNKRAGNPKLKVHVMLLPVRHDELISRLIAGDGDIAAASLTITPERQAQVDFSTPFVRDIDEIVVTGPSAKAVTSLDDLSGLELFVRESSSYAQHLRAINAELERKGLAPAVIQPADEVLEDGDVLEMVAAGLAPATVIDSWVAELYAGLLQGLKLHPEVAVNRGGEIGWAFRKGSPQLAEAVNALAKSHRQGTRTGNVLLGKYIETDKFVRNARSEQHVARFRQMIDLFRKYSQRYEFDWLLMAAQGYQESTLDQSKRSRVGAIGVMQVMPSTARDPAVGIPDIEKLESNIHAGIKYNRWVADTYFNDPGIDSVNKALLVFASYNAGPNRIAQLREEAAQQGLDPNKWFSNVEIVTARRVGREPVQYVANIYKYYLAYRMLSADKVDAGAQTPPAG
jgi:membrane-bound lytic murein transglycosylase MltF